jgi:signal transduction histidine kinase/DNA-binding response OmpR family regulator
MDSWHILVVDDEEDIHAITQLAFKRRVWRGRGFQLSHARSAEEARKLLETPEAAAGIQVAIVDVVMETPDAGLALSRYIRRTCPSALRIILRTGQPGQAPADAVLQEYDIDCYLAKSEVTAEGLFSSVCASLRSSQDISTLLALGRQIQNFTRALRRVSTIDDLLVFMHEGLRFLESKYGASLQFHYDLLQAQKVLAALDDGGPVAAPLSPHVKASAMLVDAMKTGRIKELDVFPGSEFGLEKDSFVVPFAVTDEQARSSPVYGALFATIPADSLTARALSDFRGDTLLFLENWRIAYGSLLLQERARKETMLREQMQHARMEGIAHMVTGIAHEVNTPLGVANTANSMLTSLAQQIIASPPDSPQLPELLRDFATTSTLLSKNLQRAHTLIQSFKQLSVHQLTDKRMVSELRTIVSDCLQTMAPEFRRAKIETALMGDADKAFTWDGFPGHLAQVIVNLIQNVIRYAYPAGAGGRLEIRIAPLTGDNKKGILDGFRIELQDYGAGIPAKIKPRLFEPFVTSSLGNGGTGLGLAISRNIVCDLLHGDIHVVSEEGKGATFVVDLPRVVPASSEVTDG